MATQTPTTDGPFGLQPNVAAGLAYLVGWLSGLVMLFGGGTNKVVKWAAAQSIVLWVAMWIVFFVLGFIFAMAAFTTGSFALLLTPIWWILRLGCLVLWIWTTVSGFQGKDIRIPIIAGWTQKIFASQLA